MSTYSQAQKFLDSADGGIFFGTQLEYLMEKTFDVKYGVPSYSKIFPVNNTGSEWATSVSYHVSDEAGKAKIVGNNINDLPQIDLSGKKVTQPVETVADYIKFTTLEVLQAQKLGLNLDAAKALAARRAIERALNDIFWNGNADYGLPGLFTSSLATSAVSKAWDGTASPDEIIADLSTAQNAINETSKDVFMPNIIVVTPGIRNYLFNTRMTSTGTTVGKYILEQLDWAQEIVSANELVGTAAGSTDGVLLFQKDPEVVEAIITSDITIGEPILKHFGFEVAMSARTSGLHFRHPLAGFILSAV